MKEKGLIEEVFRNDSRQSIPTLLKFQNGSLQDVDKNEVLFTKLQDNNKKTTAMVIVKDQIYHGPIEEPEELTDLYICVRNRTTNKVRILPIEEAKLRNDVYSQLEKVERAKISQEDSYKTLLLQYGGRKAARYMSNRQTMQVDIDVIKDDLENTLEESSIIENADDSIESDKYLDSIRVKYNADATKVEEIYKVTDIIPEELLSRLDIETQQVKQTQLDAIPISSDYLKDSLLKVLSEDSEDQDLKIKMIIYMDGLMKLLKARERSMIKMELSLITEKVENDIRKRFADEHLKGFKRSMFTVEKAMCHFLVLALLLSGNYEIPIQTLQEELKTTRAKLVKYGHVVFARPKSNSQVLSLRLPSTVTPLTSGFGRRKRKA